jgi:hypothetical protein
VSSPRELIAVALFLAGGFGASAGLVFVLTRETGEPPLEAAPPRRDADVVVDREPDGSLLVGGRALKGTVRVGSAGELRRILRALPTPGTGVVTVSYARNREGRGAPALPPHEVAVAHAQLKAILAEAGFHEAVRP